MGNGHEESHNKIACVYIVFALNNHADFALSLWKNNMKKVVYGKISYVNVLLTVPLYYMQNHDFQRYF